jgi:hypothetical protein
MVNSSNWQENLAFDHDSLEEVMEDGGNEPIANTFDMDTSPMFAATEEVMEDSGVNSPNSPEKDPIGNPFDQDAPSVFAFTEEVLEDASDNSDLNQPNSLEKDPISHPFDQNAPPMFAFPEEVPENPSDSTATSSQLTTTSPQSSMKIPSSALTVQEKFEEEVKNKNFFEAFMTVVREAAQLKVLTVVEDENDPLFEDDLSKLQGQPGKRMATFIELLSGDIKNIVGSRFLQNPEYQEILNFHREQVGEGQEIIEKNIGNLRNLLMELVDQQNKAENSAVNTPILEANTAEINNEYGEFYHSTRPSQTSDQFMETPNYPDYQENFQEEEVVKDPSFYIPLRQDEIIANG